MITDNVIIQDYAQALMEAASAVSVTASRLSDDFDVNLATIKTLNVLVESLRSHTVLMQQVIDEYNS